MRPVHDVIAMMKGSTYPDEWVIRGNHHDAWVHGAADPISGMVTVMEEARVVSELAKTGWKPKRTIVYCAWGGEEPGLLGSTEWVETYADDLVKKAVAYINTDGTSRGYLFAGGSHTLEKFFDQIPRLVQDPKKGITVYERRKALEKFRNMPSADGFTLSALGSGSDYSSFFQHLGIASLNLGFGGEGNGGEYHTMYDSYSHYKRFKDPDFAYGATLVKVAGRTTLRLAEAEVLPFEFTHMAKTLETYINDVQKMTDNLRESTAKENRFIRDGVYEAVNNPNDPMTVPDIKPDVPYLNFAPLQNGLAAIQKEAQAYDQATKQRMPDLESMHRLNQILMHIEQSFTREEGLPRRPWFRHFVYAPGFYTGYGVKTLPGVREAIEERHFDEAQEQIGILGKLMDEYSMQIGKASAYLVKP
jgi:N-acetylated-alpha-linked acidic dipeptidase